MSAQQIAKYLPGRAWYAMAPTGETISGRSANLAAAKRDSVAAYNKAVQSLSAEEIAPGALSVCVHCGVPIEFSGHTWAHPSQGRHTVCNWTPEMTSADTVATPSSLTTHQSIALMLGRALIPGGGAPGDFDAGYHMATESALEGLAEIFAGEDPTFDTESFLATAQGVQAG